LLYGFVTWLPTFFVHQGFSIAKSFGYALVMSLGAPIGSGIGALTADRVGGQADHHRASILAIISCDLSVCEQPDHVRPVVGLLRVIPIYVLSRCCFAIYVPELFPSRKCACVHRVSATPSVEGRRSSRRFIVVALFGITA